MLLSLVYTGFAQAEDSALKIFKKEILGYNAQKNMSLTYDSLKKNKEILDYNMWEAALKII